MKKKYFHINSISSDDSFDTKYTKLLQTKTDDDEYSDGINNLQSERFYPYFL